MAEDIAKWLDRRGLGQYAQAFAENGVELRHIPHLTDDDLKELGLPLGPRRHLQAAIETLTADQPSIRPTVPSTQEPEARPADAERRQLTVMFCDLVGSTALAEQLDPEDLHEVLRAYQQACAEAVGRFDGHIAKYIGDGLLVYFGYPQAHEDDARRAVNAGLGVVAGIVTLNRRLGERYRVELSVRVGIHTGLVVVGEMGGGETLEANAIVGETPNVAARLEGLAGPNKVAISTTTQRLVDGLFEFDDLGPQRLKGVSEPMTVYRITGVSEAPSRFEAAVAHGLTPMVGREEEIALLMKRWQQAGDGKSPVVFERKAA